MEEPYISATHLNERKYRHMTLLVENLFSIEKDMHEIQVWNAWTWFIFIVLTGTTNHSHFMLLFVVSLHFPSSKCLVQFSIAFELINQGEQITGQQEWLYKCRFETTNILIISLFHCLPVQITCFLCCSLINPSGIWVL